MSARRHAILAELGADRKPTGRLVGCLCGFRVDDSATSLGGTDAEDLLAKHLAVASLREDAGVSASQGADEVGAFVRVHSVEQGGAGVTSLTLVSTRLDFAGDSRSGQFRTGFLVDDAGARQLVASLLSTRGPSVGVAILAFDAEGRVLLGRRGKDPNRGSWVIPGGSVERGEDWILAGVREVREETGILVEVERTDRPLVLQLIEGAAHRFIFFLRARYAAGQLRAASDLSEVCFFERGAVPYSHLSPVVLPVLLRLLQEPAPVTAPAEEIEDLRVGRRLLQQIGRKLGLDRGYLDSNSEFLANRILQVLHFMSPTPPSTTADGDS